MKVLVVVPAYNEEGSIKGVIDDLRGAGVVCDIIVVNDGSADRTSGVARSAGAMVADLPLNLGIGGAVQTGLIHALEGGYDIAVQFDGDGQHRADQLPLILGPVIAGEADLVVGSRFIGGEGAGGYDVPAERRMGIRFLCSVLGGGVTDPTSGFRAMGRRAIEVFARDYPDDYPEVEAISMARRAGLRVAEAPVLMRPRTSGRSSITPILSIYYMVKVILALLVRRGPGAGLSGV